MTTEQLATRCEAVIKEGLKPYLGSTVEFTPSIVVGRRYIGFKFSDDQQFLIEVNVTEV